MSLSIDRMIALTRLGLGNLTEDDKSDEEITELLDLALWDISDRFGFKEKEYEEIVETTEDIDTYDLTELITFEDIDFDEALFLDAIHSITIYGNADGGEEGIPQKLSRKTKDWMEVNRRVPEDAETPLDAWKGKPTSYVRWGNNLILHPIPDGAYRLAISMWRGVASLISGDVEITELPRNWHEIVVEGAITRGHYYKQDYNLARQAENFRVSHERNAVLVNVKEERDARYARVEVLTDWPEPEDPE